MANPLQLPEDDETNLSELEPLNPPYPFEMRPFPYQIAGVPAEPPLKREVGIPFDTGGRGN